MAMKTNMTMCSQGHYYNAAKHSSCPLCAAEGVGQIHGTAKPGESNAAFTATVDPEMAVASNSVSCGKTVPADSVFSPFDVPTSVGGDMADEGINPVVGWLVCVEGPAKGNDYRIHAGYNYIGRDTGDIAIRGDQQISRQNHAMVAYDESDKAFYVGPSAGRNLIKVNGKTVLNPVEMQSFDVLSIGATKLVFVALCGDKFGWSEVASND